MHTADDMAKKMLAILNMPAKAQIYSSQGAAPSNNWATKPHQVQL
jgi:hypothetical protein